MRVPVEGGFARISSKSPEPTSSHFFRAAFHAPVWVKVPRSGYAAGETYLPEGVVAPGWYKPVARGLEAKIGEKLRHLEELDEAARRRES